jgi:hypothetical protein
MGQKNEIFANFIFLKMDFYILFKLNFSGFQQNTFSKNNLVKFDYKIMIFGKFHKYQFFALDQVWPIRSPKVYFYGPNCD